MSLTPPLLLLLLNTAEDSDQSLEYKELVSRLAYRIDLFDVVNMIDIALDERRDQGRQGGGGGSGIPV